MRECVVACMGLMACGGTIGDGDGVVDADEVPQVGWIAELVGRHHDVGGTAELMEDGVIELRDFTYDGGGLNTRFFLLPDGAKFDNTLELSDNMVGTPADGSTLRLPVPEGDEPWNLITFWCLPASLSLGDGVFRPPDGD